MEPEGPPTIKPWMIGAGVALLLVVYVVFKRHSSSANTNVATTPYGVPQAGSGVLEPIEITNTTPSAPAPVPAGSSGQTGLSGYGPPPTGWGLIASPTIAAMIAAAGVPVKTFLSHTGQPAQYYPLANLIHIKTPADSKRLQQQGYTIVSMHGSQYYNPNQNIKKKGFVLPATPPMSYVPQVVS